MTKFVRQDSHRHSRIGKNRKKLQKWRRPKGRDSKMRIKRRSYPSSPTIGHRSPNSQTGKINGLSPVLVHNTNDLEKINSHSIAIIAKVGAKKRLEIIKMAQEKKIKVFNLGGKNETGK